MSVVKVYQLKDEYDDRAFLRYSSVMRGWGEVDLDWYDCVYETEIDNIDAEDREEATDVLEDLWSELNTSHPYGFKGRSLSVGDIVDIDGNSFYCDPVGWKVI